MSFSCRVRFLLNEEIVLTSKRAPLLDKRFADIKKRLVMPENKDKVIESYHRLLKVLAEEVAFIEKNGPAMIPEIDFNEVRRNGGELPPSFADLVRDRGCVILRGVVDEEQAVSWESQLKHYTRRHRGVGGFPRENPQNWSLFWTPAQVQIRSHTQVLEAMRCVSKLWRVDDPSLPIDLSSQVTYADRFRIRHPSKDAEYTLPTHLDSGATERWEDPENLLNFKKIFEGEWNNWDAWVADHRVDAKTDLYSNGTSAASCWRSLQGWLSLSHTGTGEGTLRLLPSLKASLAYIMLRPLFLAGTPDGDGEWDDSQPTFPGAEPGSAQLKPTTALHPHLALERSIVGIPPVRPGDYVFWHCDLVHEVDRFHPGERDSSVVYNACTPLTPYNLDSLVNLREAFEKVARPRDFNTMLMADETERDHEDHGAKKENILSEEGMRAMGFKAFDVHEQGLSEGQREMRRIANEKLGIV
ncbi:hypothetical protein BJX63DRAFT_443355 [Aspergillus granulosus]|uniref:DUF1479-domain-containing protein n=1 Tax=Aspergillus granulosus TaxID=176169 RepID=A0ABR4HB87_9EURO